MDLCTAICTDWLGYQCQGLSEQGGEISSLGRHVENEKKKCVSDRSLRTCGESQRSEATELPDSCNQKVQGSWSPQEKEPKPANQDNETGQSLNTCQNSRYARTERQRSLVASIGYMKTASSLGQLRKGK